MLETPNLNFPLSIQSSFALILPPSCANGCRWTSLHLPFSTLSAQPLPPDAALSRNPSSPDPLWLFCGITHICDLCKIRIICAAIVKVINTQGIIIIPGPYPNKNVLPFSRVPNLPFNNLARSPITAPFPFSSLQFVKFCYLPLPQLPPRSHFFQPSSAAHPKLLCKRPSLGTVPWVTLFCQLLRLKRFKRGGLWDGSGHALQAWGPKYGSQHPHELQLR